MFNILLVVLAAVTLASDSIYSGSLAHELQSILLTYAFMKPNPTDLYCQFSLPSIGAAFINAGENENFELMKWLASRTATDPQKQAELLQMQAKTPLFFKVALLAGLEDIACAAVNGPRPDTGEIFSLAMSSITMGKFDKIKGEIPLHLLCPDHLERINSRLSVENK